MKKTKKENNMKTTIAKMITMALITVNLFSCASMSNAGKGAAAGMAIGAGGGSLVGDSKTTLLSSAAGGLIGGTIGFFIDMDQNEKAMIDIERSKLNKHSSDQEYIEVERKKLVTVKEKVAVHNEHRKYFIDPKSGKKIYIKN